MADNYLENQYETYMKQKAARQKAKSLAAKKRMEAYRKRLAEQEAEEFETDIDANDEEKQH